MKVFVINEIFQSIYVIDVFESLIWTERFNGCGDFELYLPISDDILKIVQDIQTKMKRNDDYYLYLDESDAIMIIENIEITTDAENGNHLLISGRGLESLLERRIVWVQTTINGNLQNGVKKLITDAIIKPEIAERKISNFIFKDSENEYIKSLTLGAQYTGDNLYDAILTICSANKLGFDIILNKNNQFEFMLTVGEDHSYDQIKNPYVIFSTHFENIINSDYIESGKTLKNVTLVAGEGTGVNRTQLTIGTISGLRRKELYTDARDIQTESHSQNLEEDKEKLETYKQELSDYQQKLTDEQKKYSEETDSYNAEALKFMELRQDYENRISLFEARINYYNNLISTYKGTLDSAQLQAFNLREQHKVKLTECEFAISEVNRAIDTYYDIIRTKQKLTYAELVQCENAIINEEGRLDGLNASKKGLEDLISSYEKQLPNYENQLSQYERAISEYEEVINDDWALIDKEDSSFNEKEAEFYSKMNEINQAINTYQSQIAYTNQKITEYENKVISDQNELTEWYLGLLEERGLEKLSENLYTKAFTSEVEPIKTFVYGRDFYKGDIVQIVNEYGMKAKVRVSEIIRTQDTTGYKTYPTFEVFE